MFAEILAISPWLLAAAVAAVFLGAVIQHAMGLGFGMVVSPILLLIDPSFVPAVVIMLGFTSSMPNMLTNRRLLDLRQFTIILAGRLVGIGGGVFVLVHLVKGTDTRAFAILFAVLMLVAVAMSLGGRMASAFRPTGGNLTFFGFLSGLFSTVTSVGGPPLALVYQNSAPDFARTQMQYGLGVGALLTTIGLAAGGLVGTFQLVSAAVLVPVVLLGCALASRLAPHFHGNYRNLILGIVTVSALAILARALLW